mgnify:CR=1 FL=1
MSYVYLTRDKNQITFEDPSNPTSTLVQRRKVTFPNISGNRVPFVRSETRIDRQVDPRNPDCIKDCSILDASQSLNLTFVVANTPAGAAQAKAMWNTMKKYIDANISTILAGRSLADNAVIEVDPVQSYSL